MRRIARWLGLGVLALALLLAVAGALGLAWLNTGAGLRSVARLATGAVPGLRLEGLQGPLPWRLAVDRLGYADAAGEWLWLEQAEVALDLPALLHGTLRITTIQARRLGLARLPAAGPSPTPTKDQVLPRLPRLPLAVEVARLAIDRIELSAPVLGQAAVFQLRGSAAARHDARHDALGATLALERLDAAGRVALDLALSPGDQFDASLTAEDAAGGPLASLAGQPDQPLSLALRLAGPASSAALTLRASVGEALRLEANGIASGTADGRLALRLEGQASAAPLLPDSLAPLASPARFSLDATLAASRQLTLALGRLEAPGGTLQAHGKLDLESEALDLALDLQLAAAARYAGLLPEGLGWDSNRVEAQLTGTLSRPRIVAQASLTGATTGTPALDAALGPAPGLHLSLALPEQQVSLRVQGAAATLEASGSAAEPLELSARLALPRLAALGPGFEGSAELNATLRGPRQDPDVSLQARSDRLVLNGQALEGFRLAASLHQAISRPAGSASAQGSYAGLPLTLSLRARPEGERVLLDAAEAGLGAARLNADGSLDLASRIFTGTLHLTVPELAPLARLAGQPGLAGRLAGTLALSPQPPPQGASQGASQGFTLRLEAPALAFAGQTGSLRAQAEGTPAGFGFSLDGTSPLARLATQGRVELGSAAWRLDLARLEAAGFNETLRLLAPARVSGRPDGGIELAGLTLGFGRGGQLDARGSWGPAQADMSLRLNALPLPLAQAALPGVPLQGRLDGEVRASGPVASPVVTLRLNGSGLRAGPPALNALPAASLQAEARLAGGAYTLTAEASAGALVRLRAALRLPAGPPGPLQGTLDGALDLGGLAAPFLAAGGDRVTGRLTLALGLGGTLAAPTLSGQASLADGSYRNLPLGIRLTDLAGTLRGDSDHLRIESLTGRTPGGGRVALAGSLHPMAPGLPVALALTARNARPVSSDLLTATLDADLRLDGPLAAGARASGRLSVARADIRVPERLPASVASLPNVRQRGPLPPGRTQAAPPAAPGPAPPALELELQVAVRRAFIRGRGLDAELGGAFALAGTSAAPVVTGGLELARGTLSVLARRLTFQRGAITFASGTLMPQLDLAASTTAGTATLTASVTGTPQAPQVSFSSSPELPQDEILARLIFDRPTSNLSPFEIAQLASAAAELTGVGSTGGLVDRLRGGLGLDRLGVTSDPTNASGAALEAGRYVAPGVYLGVRQGSNGTTGVGAQLELTDRLKLEGQTATGPAGDRLGLSYEMEY